MLTDHDELVKLIRKMRTLWDAYATETDMLGDMFNEATDLQNKASDAWTETSKLGTARTKTWNDLVDLWGEFLQAMKIEEEEIL